MELPLLKTKSKATPGVDQFAHFQVYRKRDGSLSVLGQGAMGITYRARDIQLDRDVALKVISPHLVGDDRARARFLRESKAAAALQHPHVAAILFQGEEEKTCFYAMELIHGETLENYIVRTGPLSTGPALELARQIMGGLDAAHQRGLVHGDLTPGNLMLTSYERTGDLHLKIIDFGLSRLVQEARPLTQNSEGIFGTPGYASPEHWENTLPDCRSDIYSVGAILWFMVEGQPPFEGTPVSIVRRQAIEPTPFELLKNQPWSVRNLIQDLMQLKPEDRPKDPALVLERIAQAELDLPEMEEVPPQKLYFPTQVLHSLQETALPKKSPWRFLLWFLFGGTLFVMGLLAPVVALVIWLFSESSTPSETPKTAPAMSHYLGLSVADLKNPIAGKWASTSGSVIVVSDSATDFVLNVTHEDGTFYKLQANWVKGMEGKQFTFLNEYRDNLNENGRLVTATFDPKQPNQVTLTVEGRVYYWKRI